MKQKRRLITTILLFVLVGQLGCGDDRSSAPTDWLPVTDELLAASELIDTPGILESVTYLGGDAVEGRGPGTPGDRRTREYLAARLDRIGLVPAFDGSWDQPVRIVGVDSLVPDEWTFHGPEAEVSFRFREDYMGASGLQQAEVAIEDAEVVFVGYGVLPGSDPALAGQYVIYSAHHDHLGIGEPDASGDTIYNGALDNGVAMAQTLAIAEAFASLPRQPRRSLMFLYPAAEEQGLLGSKYFAESGVLPPGKIIANINLELGNVWGPTEDVVVFGKGKNTLEETLAELAPLQDRSVRADDDPRAGWYYRSDQFSLARVGVPAIWFRSGTRVRGRPEGWGEERFREWIATHYHQPIDEVSPDWNLDGLVEDARLAFWLGAVVAEGEEMPAWYPGDEFEGARKVSLAGE